jgi:hypothetical protein
MPFKDAGAVSAFLPVLTAGRHVTVFSDQCTPILEERFIIKANIRCAWLKA